MDKNELQEILEQHQLWLDDNGGKRADLQGADLRGANLRSAQLGFITRDEAVEYDYC